MELLAVVGVSVLARLALVGTARPALFWDSGSYLRVAEKILEHGFPPSLGLRPPGYPLFIIATSWGGSFLGGTVIAQHLLGVGTSVLMYLILVRITRSRVAGLLGVLAFSMMPDVLFMEVTIYSETVAMCLVTSCAFLMVAPRGQVAAVGGLAAVWDCDGFGHVDSTHYPCPHPGRCHGDTHERGVDGQAREESGSPPAATVCCGRQVSGGVLIAGGAVERWSDDVAWRD